MDNKKPELFLDFDGTIVNTRKRICEMYNEDFVWGGGKKARWRKVDKYNFSDECPKLTREVLSYYFKTPRFFDGLEFEEDAEHTINKLSSAYKIIVATLGELENLQLKEFMIVDNDLPIDEFIGIDSAIYKDKSHINMNDGLLTGDHSIFVDDCSNNLYNSNAEIKICYGGVHSWNMDWEKKRCYTWNDIESYLNL